MLTVLVVENNPTILKLISYHLELNGCKVLTALDGLEALVVLDNKTVDILFTDIIMPKVSGDQLCRIVRRNSGLKDLFIAVHSSTAVEDNRQILDIDADVYIAKGPNINLKMHVHHVLQQFKDGKRRVQTIVGAELLHSRAITKELLLARNHYHAIFNNVAEVVVELDSCGQIIQANRAARKLFGKDTISLLLANFIDFLSGPEKNDVIAWIKNEHESGSTSFNSSYENPLIVKDHKVLLKMVSIREQKKSFIICILQDITQQKMAERKLARTLGEFNAVIDTIDYGVLLMDSELIVHNSNHAFRNMWDIPESVVDSGLSMRELMEYNRHKDIYDITCETFNDYIDNREKAIRQGTVKPIELRLSDNRVFQYQCVVLPDNGRMLTYYDITNLKQTERKLEEALEEVKKLANHDPLTGLPNQRLAQERMLHTISQCKRNSSKAAIMFIDLDGFKEVNDSHGHDIGDKLLKKVADRLKSCFRGSDTVARIGGDEFLIILTEVTERSAIVKVAKKIINKINNPFSLAGKEISIGASIGISIYPDHGQNSRVLLKKADNAMYATKRSEHKKYTFSPK